MSLTATWSVGADSTVEVCDFTRSATPIASFGFAATTADADNLLKGGGYQRSEDWAFLDDPDSPRVCMFAAVIW